MPRKLFHVILNRPTKYDDDGYPIHWHRTTIPANSLACLNGIVRDCEKRKVLGRDIDLNILSIDEGNSRILPEKLIAHINRNGGRGLVCFTGVQSNQFPRAVDLAHTFLKAGLPVSIGGFHVTGCMAMLPEMPIEMLEAQKHGISFFWAKLKAGASTRFCEMPSKANSNRSITI